jgi:putative hydrolase of HD superfamily
MAAVLVEHANAPRLDLLKVVKMLLVHDLVEIHAGDTWLYDAAAIRDQPAREAAAAEALFGLLPGDQAGELRALWTEFEARGSPEAVYAAAIDALQPLANHLRFSEVDAEPRPTEGEVLARKRHIAEGSATLWELARRLVDESARRGLYRREG